MPSSSGNAYFVEGLGQLLQAEDDTDATPDPLALCEEQRRDVGGLEADGVERDPGRLARTLKRAVPHVRILGLTTVQMARADTARAHSDGIRGVLPRSAGFDQTWSASGPRHRGSGSARPPVTEHSSTVDLSETDLTPSEPPTLNPVGSGFTSREISSQLISHKTVENHKQRIFGKLGVQNQANAVSVAMRLGLMRPERVIGLAQAD